MVASWNVNEIEKMSDEGKVRNRVRQLRDEVETWNRPLGYAGKAVRSRDYLPHGVSLLMGGNAGCQWVTVEVECVPVTGRIYLRNADYADLYATIMGYAIA